MQIELAPGLFGTLVLFFLPWVLTSCGNDPMREFNGWQLAIGEGGAGEGYKGNADSFGVTITSIIILLLIFQQFLTTSSEGINREILYGLWGYILAWIVVLIGGVINIVEQKKPA
jgi:hypothetical protein